MPFFFGLPSGGGGIQRKQKGKNHQMGKTLSPRGVTAPEVVCPPFFFLATGGKEKVFLFLPVPECKMGKGGFTARRRQEFLKFAGSPFCGRVSCGGKAKKETLAEFLRGLLRPSSSFDTTSDPGRRDEEGRPKSRPEEYPEVSSSFQDWNG